MSAPESDDRPRDVQAEQAVLGACLLDPDAIPTVMRLLSGPDFYQPAHEALWSTLTSEWELGNPTDPVAICAALEQSGELLRVGGAPYLHTLIAGVPTTANAGYYAEIVVDKACRARLVDAGVRIRQLGAQSAGDIGEVQERARETIDAATKSRQHADEVDGGWIGDLIDDHIAEWDRPRHGGVMSPWASLNDVTGGLHPGQVLVVAGRPGSGKSTVAKDWAVHAAKAGLSVEFVSLEMTRGEVIDRMISTESKVRLASIRHRTLDPEEKYKATRIVDDLRDLPLHIEDKFVSTLASLRARVRERARSEQGLDFLLIDHIGLLEPRDSRQNRNEQITEFSRGFKLLAKELNIPVLVVSQLNRGPDTRPDHVPQLSDLRDSGSLEQDADMVLLVFRPDYYDHESPRSGEADLILAKQRNGPTSTITVAHQLHYARFTDLARG